MAVSQGGKHDPLAVGCRSGERGGVLPPVESKAWFPREAAYWAAWADALPVIVIAQRRPGMADHCITQLTLGAHSSRACFRAAATAGAFLREHGWEACPPWEAFRTPSVSHPRLDAGEPSLALHGWQHAATLATSTSYRERVVLPSLTAAGHTLTSAALAPGTPATLAALTNPERRPPALTRPLPDHLPAFQPATALQLTQRDQQPDFPAPLSMEHYKLLLESEEGLQLFTHAVTQLGQAAVPEPILRALALSRLTALTKPGGAGVRGIATGDALRRLTARTLARTHAAVFDTATRPYQFALHACAGTDALAAVLSAALDTDPSITVVSVDGRSAYDTISRVAVFNKLLEVAPALVPFTRAWYGAPSEFLWWEQHNVCHRVPHGEGLEQGDALAPALFALGQHDALTGAAEQLLPTECLAAYLDDLYVVTTPDRARLAYDTVTRAVQLPVVSWGHVVCLPSYSSAVRASTGRCFMCPFLHPWVAYAIALLSCFRSWLSFWPSSFPMVAADFVATLQVACDAKLELLQRFAASSWEPELFIVPDATAGGDHVGDMAIVFAGPLAEALGRHSWDHKPEFLAALRCLRAFGLLSDDFAQVEFVRGMARFAADVANFAGQ
ncbi:unnamed protein product [Cladocopium goreaui]|uniref:Retrotransposable element SLACS 132 kDa protein (ORF2) n=1 Tax=Cladocopium goreaui TaxID=2562237 RepID=A0A9P1BTG4_9DINO|nr:unnamed protein product [Cladocopium goreaui]